MDSIWINAPAKINIGLDVIRRREDGYHEVKNDYAEQSACLSG